MYVAKQLDPRYISIAQAIHDELRAYEDRQIGIVCPVHVQRMPELVAAFLRHARFDTAYFYIILTYGSRYGNAPRQACDLAQSLGIRPAYVNVVWMADNFLPEADIEEEMLARVNVLQEVSKSMAEELGREAKLSELAERMKMTEDEVREIMKVTMDALSMSKINQSLQS